MPTNECGRSTEIHIGAEEHSWLSRRYPVGPTEEVGVIVTGSSARKLVDAWIAALNGKRIGQQAEVRLRRGRCFVDREVRVTVWDVSSTPRSLLPLFAQRCHILLLLRESKVATVLEEMLPSTHPLTVVAVAHQQTAMGSFQREMEARAIVCVELDVQSPVILLETLVARHCAQLRSLVDVDIQRYEVVGERRSSIAFFEVRCVIAAKCSGDSEFGWATPRRYSEFDALRRRLGNPRSVPFPTARRSLDSVLAHAGLWFQDNRFLERRRRELDRWLKALVHAASLITTTRSLLDFLDPGGQLKDNLSRIRAQDLNHLQSIIDAKDMADLSLSPDLALSGPAVSN